MTAREPLFRFDKKGVEKQFLINSEDLEHVHSPSSLLQVTTP